MPLGRVCTSLSLSLSYAGRVTALFLDTDAANSVRIDPPQLNRVFTYSAHPGSTSVQLDTLLSAPSFWCAVDGLGFVSLMTSPGEVRFKEGESDRAKNTSPFSFVWAVGC